MDEFNRLASYAKINVDTLYNYNEVAKG
jgi:hypothetical protein